MSNGVSLPPDELRYWDELIDQRWIDARPTNRVFPISIDRNGEVHCTIGPSRNSIAEEVDDAIGNDVWWDSKCVMGAWLRMAVNAEKVARSNDCDREWLCADLN